MDNKLKAQRESVLHTVCKRRHSERGRIHEGQFGFIKNMIEKSTTTKKGKATTKNAKTALTKRETKPIDLLTTY